MTTAPRSRERKQPYIIPSLIPQRRHEAESTNNSRGSVPCQLVAKAVEEYLYLG